jgi:hypothetical protein
MATQMTDPHERGLILGQQRELLGETWAKVWFQALRTEGRPVAGGWPGTLQEARYRARMHCDRELSRRGQPPLSQDELHLVAAAIYERAKRDWMRVVREGKVAKTSSY